MNSLNPVLIRKAEAIRLARLRGQGVTSGGKKQAPKKKANVPDESLGEVILDTVNSAIKGLRSGKFLSRGAHAVGALDLAKTFEKHGLGYTKGGCCDMCGGKMKRGKKAGPKKPKRAPSKYNLFVKKHMKDRNIVHLPVQERMKIIGAMWSQQ